MPATRMLYRIGGPGRGNCSLLLVATLTIGMSSRYKHVHVHMGKYRASKIQHINQNKHVICSHSHGPLTMTLCRVFDTTKNIQQTMPF